MDKKSILVTQSSVPTVEEYTEEIKSIFDSKWLTNGGVKHQELEKKLKEKLKVNEVALFTNGHMALYTAIHLMNFPKGGEVITTPFTFASTTHAIVQNGLLPVFCDINRDDYTIDVSKIESLITDKTVAIVPVHVYGHVCDVDAIEKIAKKHNLKVIYDAAHVFGVEINGRGIGSYGDVSMFSFHATKVFNTIEGGCLTLNDDTLKTKIDRFKNFGIATPDRIEMCGINSKMNEFCAAMGLCNLRHIDQWEKQREIVYDRYQSNLTGVEGVILPKYQENVKENYAYYPVIFDEKKFGKSRDEVLEELSQHNIGARKYFYPLTNDFDCYTTYNKDGHVKGIFDSSRTPVAKWCSDRVLTLPMYADLSLEDVDRICNIIKKACKSC